jgi:hypothetical protein
MSITLRNILIGVGVVFFAWICYELYRAGGGPPPPPPGQVKTQFKNGTATGQSKTHLPAWSLDYESITIGPDGYTNTLENVKDGRFYNKDGKPAAKIKAKHIVVNTISNDFVETGPIEITEIDGKHNRHFVSDEATYQGATQTVILSHPTTVTSDGGTAKIKKAIFNFKTGDMKTEGMIGTY